MVGLLAEYSSQPKRLGSSYPNRVNRRELHSHLCRYARPGTYGVERETSSWVLEGDRDDTSDERILPKLSPLGQALVWSTCWVGVMNPGSQKRAESYDIAVVDLDEEHADFKAARRKVLLELFQLFGLPSTSIEVRKKSIRIVIDIPFEPTSIELAALETAFTDH